MKKLKKYFKSVIEELKKVKWPSKKEMVKYTASTIVFVVLLSGFFYAVTLLMALLKTVM